MLFGPQDVGVLVGVSEAKRPVLAPSSLAPGNLQLQIPVTWSTGYLVYLLPGQLGVLVTWTTCYLDFWTLMEPVLGPKEPVLGTKLEAKKWFSYWQG